MKKVKENLKKIVLTAMIAMVALNIGSLRAYAEEEETIYEQAEEEVLEQAEVSEEIAEEVEETAEEIAEAEEEIETVEEEAEEVIEQAEEVSWNSYTLYNYISINDGKSYISLNTQENGITAPKSPAEFQKEHGNKRYDLNAGEYVIADYDLTSLVLNIGGFSFVEQSVAKEGQPYFIARLDRVEAVAAANFRPSSSVEGIESFTSLDNSNITFHRNWYLTLVTPMTDNRLLTGVRFGDGKNGIGDGKYYGIAFTENFQAIDSRLIPFGTKLNASQYSIEDYDFTDLVLTYKGEKYAYRPNGPVAGDGENFHYYTVSLMKIDKLNKSTYGGGYLVENWPAWSLINSSASGTDGYPYAAGYYHRDYQATLMVGDAPVAVEEEPVIEVLPAAVEKAAAVEEVAPIVEKKMIVEEADEKTEAEDVIAVSEEETVAETVKEENVTVIENVNENVNVEEAAAAPSVSVAADTDVPSAAEVKEETASKEAATEEDEIVIREEAAPLAAPALIEETGRWALANLVCALVSIIAALGMIFTMKRKEDAKVNLSKFLGMIPAALAIPFILLTENMNGTMIIADSYTIMMILFPLVSLLIARLTRNEDKGTDLI